MDNRFKRKSEIKHGILNIVLHGTLGDDTDLGSVPADAIKQVFIDFEGAKYISSTGIKKWLQWCSQIAKSHPQAKIQLLNCQEPIVNQMNLVRNFLPKGSYG